MSHTACVLVSYYPAYHARAVWELKRLLRPINPDLRLLVVHNGGQVLPLAASTEVIPGDNAQREFSGYRVGLEALRQRGDLADASLVVFANDTFCHHNKFGWWSRLMWRSALRGLQHEQSPALLGEVWHTSAGFGLLGHVAKSWVATYLFAVSGRGLPLLPPFCPTTPPLAGPAVSDLFDSYAASPNLRRHIENWLRKHQGVFLQRQGAAPAAPGTEIDPRLCGKAQSILLEMALSAAAVAHGLQLRSPFTSRPLTFLRRLEGTRAAAVPH
jgi:hypothetical protein